MWLFMAFVSAALLGFYDVFKKKALSGNAVLPVLFINTLICSLLFLPFIVISSVSPLLEETSFYVPVCDWEFHILVFLQLGIFLRH